MTAKLDSKNHPLLGLCEESGKTTEKQAFWDNPNDPIGQGVRDTMGPEREPWCPEHWTQSQETQTGEPKLHRQAK